MRGHAIENRAAPPQLREERVEYVRVCLLERGLAQQRADVVLLLVPPATQCPPVDVDDVEERVDQLVDRRVRPRRLLIIDLLQPPSQCPLGSLVRVRRAGRDRLTDMDRLW